MNAVFSGMMARGEKIFVGYFPVGDPCVADTFSWVKRFLDNGVTVLEIGLPYERPVLDGAVVRASMERALQRTNLTEVFQEIGRVRAAFPEAILQVMTYVEIVQSYGYEQFADLCHGAGVDAVLSANAGPAQMSELDRALAPYEVDNLRFVPYHIHQEHVSDLQKNAAGYVYLQAIDGATGTGGAMTGQLAHNLASLRDAGISIPLIPGFGIDTPEKVRACLSMGADGVVVGSAIIKNILSGTGEGYIKSLSDALR